MMQGIVVTGTGKNAALNGYSSAGKTGTAQKVDPATHTYSHTKLVASFAGFAPVSSPAISVAVIMDTPQGSDLQRYGGTASAPVFAQVAQQVLEYLGVPHDQALKTPKEMQEEKKSAPEEGLSDPDPNLQAMFDDVNALPADDPLRSPGLLAVKADAPEPTVPASRHLDGLMRLLPERVLAAFRANGGTTSAMPDAAEGARAKLLPTLLMKPEVKGGGVVVDASKQIAVPSFDGVDLRLAVERAGGAGLRIRPVGSGLAREQVPAAGTMVPSGSEVIVRFLR